MKLPDPAVRFDVDENKWFLKEAYFFETNDGFGCVIPPGFRFDLASVPRVGWLFIAPFELSIAAPLVHDYLYSRGGRPEWIQAGGRAQVSRKEADGFFNDLMKERRVPGWRRFSAHVAVRLFGGIWAWQ